MNGIIDIDATIANAAAEFPALARLFGGYFHQDWHEEYETTSSAVTAFLHDAPSVTAAAAAADVERLLALGLDDELLGRVLREGFDCNYVPAVDELTSMQWLQQLRGLLPARAGG